MSFSAETRYDDLNVLILAAGKGTRMRNDRAKVLQTVLGEPMLWYVYETAGSLLDRSLIWTVVGHQSEAVQSAFPHMSDRFLLQSEQLGTGHALQIAYNPLRDSGRSWCLVINGDAPLLKPRSLRKLVDETVSGDVDFGFMTVELEDPTGYGRILRDRAGHPQRIVEEKDLGSEDAERSTGEVNAGVYCLRLERIKPYLDRLTNDNRQGEYYITQLIDLLVRDGAGVAAVRGGSDPNFLGINSPKELVYAERILQQQIVQQHLENGVIVRNPDQASIGPRVSIEPGTDLTGPLEIRGRTEIGSGSSLHSHVWIRDCQLGTECVVKPFSHLEESSIGSGCEIGPYARLRPGTEMREKSRVGNFVEVKKSLLDEGCKVNHLSYIGDAEIGRQSNVGAGTITCNYDGRKKHRTAIGESAFIGSNTALVAPVRIGRGSIVGAGSTVTKDVPDFMLAVARGKQRNIVLRKLRGRDD
jgi:bifunctional UDP-N-acetylglucosamine pyrophosphorylase/glucosamine-1-phosphate N-acetyltransferase